MSLEFHFSLSSFVLFHLAFTQLIPLEPFTKWEIAERDRGRDKKKRKERKKNVYCKEGTKEGKKKRKKLHNGVFAHLLVFQLQTDNKHN